MEPLVGYIISACLGVAGTYVSQYLTPKVKIRFWVSHNFLCTMPIQTTATPPTSGQLAVAQSNLPSPPTFKLLTQSVTIQNFGRQAAEWVDIVHLQRPDFFQLYPSLNYTESTTPAGEHVLRVNSIAPKEWFMIQLISYKTEPNLLYIKSAAGQASLMPWMSVRKYPQWVYNLVRVLTLIGAGYCVYWIAKFGLFLLSLRHK